MSGGGELLWVARTTSAIAMASRGVISQRERAISSTALALGTKQENKARAHPHAGIFPSSRRRTTIPHASRHGDVTLHDTQEGYIAPEAPGRSSIAIHQVYKIRDGDHDDTCKDEDQAWKGRSSTEDFGEWASLAAGSRVWLGVGEMRDDLLRRARGTTSGNGEGLEAGCVSRVLWSRDGCLRRVMLLRRFALVPLFPRTQPN
ncbi:hypothetical protein C8F01DRAFT_369869 [Mycena amicta]|nr:hypothetical protein C8F01DRAFT_369869 [Mycena amicta]